MGLLSPGNRVIPAHHPPRPETKAGIRWYNQLNYTMKTQQLISKTQAQSLKALAKKIGFKVKFQPKPNIVKGEHILLELEGSADNFLKLGQFVKPDKGAKLFSNWSVGSGRITKLKRILSRADILPSQMRKELIKMGCNKKTISSTRQYITEELITNSHCFVSIGYPNGGRDRLNYSF